MCGMRTFIEVKERKVPVYSDEAQSHKKIKLLSNVLNEKMVHGRKAVKKALDYVISIEIVDSDAILHTLDERDSIALSLY